jgi:hypothetical protein
MPPQFHLCLSPDTIETDAQLLRLVKEAGISEIWITGFLYGHWYYSLERIRQACEIVRAAGMIPQLINLPLGHPGDSLGAQSDSVPLGPPGHWRMGLQADGTTHSGTSLHDPAVDENCRALQELAGLVVGKIFLDDDFRLAAAPGMIGGCFCDEHRRRFLAAHGLQAADWERLLQDVAQRSDSALLRQWLDFCCDELSEAFRRQQAAVPGIELGNMVMYLGSEKAGIRLADFSAALFRVGEYMFNDAIFGPVKGKTDELFSVLFHRRFCAPERSYSESTAFPAGELAADNLAAKMVISLIADVRNTMFMSGLTPFPRQHWIRLAEAIQRQRRIFPLVEGLRPRGPLKHVWGMASRYSGADQPYSLFLALGIPFEVVETPQPGWNFLSQADVLALRGVNFSADTRLVYRPVDCAGLENGLALEESLTALFEFKHQVVAQLRDVPYIKEDVPAVCAWYPQGQRALVWNLSESAQALTLCLNERTRVIQLGPLDVEAVSL